MKAFLTGIKVAAVANTTVTSYRGRSGAGKALSESVERLLPWDITPRVARSFVGLNLPNAQAQRADCMARIVPRAARRKHDS